MEPYAASVLAQVQIAYHAASIEAYILIALGTTLFGNLVAIPAILLGFDGSLGKSGFLVIPGVVLVGHLFGDFFWYTLGRSLSETKVGEWLKKRLPTHKRVERFFETGSVTLLAASKLLATPTVPILFLLGWYCTPTKRYARLSLLSAALWFAGTLIFSLLVYSGIKLVV